MIAEPLGLSEEHCHSDVSPGSLQSADERIRRTTGGIDIVDDQYSLTSEEVSVDTKQVLDVARELIFAGDVCPFAVAHNLDVAEAVDGTLLLTQQLREPLPPADMGAIIQQSVIPSRTVQHQKQVMKGKDRYSVVANSQKRTDNREVATRHKKSRPAHLCESLPC